MFKYNQFLRGGVLMKKNFELTTVRLSHKLLRRIRELSKAHEVSQGTVIRQLLRIGERHFAEEGFRLTAAADCQKGCSQEQLEFNFEGEEEGHAKDAK
jgi:hypothetical protein